MLCQFPHAFQMPEAQDSTTSPWQAWVFHGTITTDIMMDQLHTLIALLFCKLKACLPMLHDVLKAKNPIPYEGMQTLFSARIYTVTLKLGRTKKVNVLKHNTEPSKGILDRVDTQKSKERSCMARFWRFRDLEFWWYI